MRSKTLRAPSLTGPCGRAPRPCAEAGARGHQEAEIDQHEQGGAGHRLEHGGGAAEIGRLLEPAEQLVEGRRHLQVQHRGGLGDQGVDPGVQLGAVGGEAREAVRDHPGGAQEDADDQDQRRRHGRRLGDERRQPAHAAREAVDHHQQEGGERQRADDVAQPVQPGAGRARAMTTSVARTVGEGMGGRTNELGQWSPAHYTLRLAAGISSQGSCRAEFARRGGPRRGRCPPAAGPRAGRGRAPRPAAGSRRRPAARRCRRRAGAG